MGTDGRAGDRAGVRALRRIRRKIVASSLANYVLTGGDGGGDGGGGRGGHGRGGGGECSVVAAEAAVPVLLAVESSENLTPVAILNTLSDGTSIDEHFLTRHENGGF